MLDSRCQVDTVYLDFSKAFDKVNHELLLLKLRRMGIGGKLLRWFSDYLSGRYQKVTVLGETSHSLPVLSGVPQGSILGPLLFLVYVNDLPTCVSSTSSVAMFADDTKCYRRIKSVDDAEALQLDLNRIAEWCMKWQMELNQGKCCVLRVTRNTNPTLYQYRLHGQELKSVNKQRDLGVIVTEDLKWTTNVRDVSSKANRMLGYVKRASYDMREPKSRKILYLALVRSKLGYCSQVWAPQTVGDILSLERIQRRATKFILSLPFRTEITYVQRLCRLNLVPLTYWHEYLDLMFLFKHITEKSDPNIVIKIPTRITRHTFSHSKLIVVSRSKTVSHQNSFYVRSARTWNSLPAYIINCTSVSQFKSNLLNYYFFLTANIYDPDLPQSFKTVCVKCHRARPIETIKETLCC